MDNVKHVSYAVDVQMQCVKENKSERPLPRIPTTDDKPDNTELRYLAFLRKRNDGDSCPKPCLPPLTIRTVQGKYGISGSHATAPSHHGYHSSSSNASKGRAQSVPGDIGKAKKEEAPIRSKTSMLNNDRFNFPREFWEGPLFKIYRNNPKLKSSMTLHRVRALKSLLHVNNFEEKTGFSEKNYEPEEDGLSDLLEMARWARNKKDLNRPGTIKLESANNHRKSIANRLPTINDG